MNDSIQNSRIQDCLADMVLIEPQEKVEKQEINLYFTMIFCSKKSAVKRKYEGRGDDLTWPACAAGEL